ncbi:MAG: metal-dependent hydrolase [Aquabacterium sp.]|nr:MAG: metal-dependent hydrolase [Aquabacterium sp.]
MSTPVPDPVHRPAGAQAIVPREKLDFDLDGDIPRYWFGGDAFKTRFFDAMSTIFPEGERFFIVCVRDYRDRVSDPQLQQDIKDFIRQEGQHGMLHDCFNNRLKQQGIDVDGIERVQRWFIDFARKYNSKAFTISMTAAAEHMTAIMAHSFFGRREVMAECDSRMRALYAWHAMEEIEHKTVAFDVMQKTAGVGYLMRMLGMLQVSIGFPVNTFLVMRYMFRIDGFRWWQLPGLWARGFWWLYKPRTGLFSSVLGHYFSYLRPGFHPAQEGQTESYRVWLDTFNSTRDPIRASEAVLAVAA